LSISSKARTETVCHPSSVAGPVSGLSHALQPCPSTLHSYVISLGGATSSTPANANCPYPGTSAPSAGPAVIVVSGGT
jgi:hypothetical protein